MAKRLFDTGISLLFLLVLGPAIAVIALLIRLDSTGPAFWLSERVGMNGKPFYPYRFRTMHIGGRSHLPPEERLTRVGRFIRNYSLDHWPTVINVLRGEMSLIGPRSEAPRLVDLEDPTWQKILSVKPGLMSLAVLCLGREYNASSQAARNELELEYVENQSFAYDLKLLLKVAQALIASRGNVKARGEPQ